ncbi:hypothetical protein LINGRAHAP2_LOCUS16450 [Linum grandiflorum]
MRLERI